MKKLITLFLFFQVALFAENQTLSVSEVHSENSLPFRLRIQQASFSLPTGLQSFVSAIYKDKWLIIGGRTNGMHGFNPTNNFPPEKQNTRIYVVDLKKKQTYSKSLFNDMAGLSQQQIDTLSVTSAQSYHTSKTLYISGGYGIDTASGLFTTKNTLTAIDIPDIIQWVINPKKGQLASKSIRQINNPVFQVTGGYMDKTAFGDTLLIFGQNFAGQYTNNSDGIYTQQIRKFKIEDKGNKLEVHKIRYGATNPNFRRRDLNVVPVMQDTLGLAIPGFIAFSGVFTESGGIWTIPVEISSKGKTFMQDPASAFKQAMNNYEGAAISLYSGEDHAAYVIIPGGLTYGYFQNGAFATDPEIPFTNQVTTIKRDRNGEYTQYIMSAEYPFIASTGANPGNELLFGSGAAFMLAKDIANYPNGVIKLEKIKKTTLIGYIVGGIASTVPNTSTDSDSIASPYIFEVYLEPI
jgi:hypothetical protein